MTHSARVEVTYGLRPGQYQELLLFQQGRCYICQRRPGAKRLAVDHDHATGEVRGLLCRGCNRDVLGHLREDRLALARALEYLEEPPASLLWPGRVPRQPTGDDSA
ncbi:MAG: endonuclease VII domain-containing protein [Dermatophilaceae bacterium]